MAASWTTPTMKVEVYGSTLLSTVSNTFTVWEGGEVQINVQFVEIIRRKILSKKVDMMRIFP